MHIGVVFFKDSILCVSNYPLSFLPDTPYNRIIAPMYDTSGFLGGYFNPWVSVKNTNQYPDTSQGEN